MAKNEKKDFENWKKEYELIGRLGDLLRCFHKLNPELYNERGNLGKICPLGFSEGEVSPYTKEEIHRILWHPYLNNRDGKDGNDSLDEFIYSVEIDKYSFDEIILHNFNIYKKNYERKKNACKELGKTMKEIGYKYFNDTPEKYLDFMIEQKKLERLYHEWQVSNMP